MQWHHPETPTRKEFVTRHSADKVMASVFFCFFFDVQGILFLDFIEDGTTINSQYSCELHDKVKPANRTKWSCLLSNGVILHDNACPYTATDDDYFAEHELESPIPYSSYSPDLLPCDFQPFGPLKEHIGREKFLTN